MKTTSIVIATLAAAAIGTAAFVFAEDKMDHSKMDHSKMDMSGASANDTPATKAFRAANDKMHGDMSMAFTGDADIDFINGMLPHHQGAIDMAKIVLQYGRDPETKKLAQDIIKAQNTEIEFMKGLAREESEIKT